MKKSAGLCRYLTGKTACRAGGDSVESRNSKIPFADNGALLSITHSGFSFTQNATRIGCGIELVYAIRVEFPFSRSKSVNPGFFPFSKLPSLFSHCNARAPD